MNLFKWAMGVKLSMVPTVAGWLILGDVTGAVGNEDSSVLMV